MKPPESPSSGRLIFGDFVIDPQAAQLLKQVRAIDLRPKSFEVLCLLAQNAERVVSGDELAAAVWRGHGATDEAIAQRIRTRSWTGSSLRRWCPWTARATADRDTAGRTA